MKGEGDGGGDNLPSRKNYATSECVKLEGQLDLGLFDFQRVVGGWFGTGMYAWTFLGAGMLAGHLFFFQNHPPLPLKG